MEAIIYYEQLNRSELITFLDKFKDVLMVSTYEDPNPLVRLPVKLTWIFSFIFRAQNIL